MNNRIDSEELARTSLDTSAAAVGREEERIVLRSPRRGAEWWDDIWRSTSSGRGLSSSHEDFGRPGFDESKSSLDDGPSARSSGDVFWNRQPWWRQRIR